MKAYLITFVLIIAGNFGANKIYDWYEYRNLASSSFHVDSNLFYPERITEYEVERLFPNYKEDWYFAQSLVGVTGLRIPKMSWMQSDENYGVFRGRYDDVGLNHIIFATSTHNFARDTLIHEFVHAALFVSYDSKKDDHCYMAENQMFIKIGNYIGNEELGKINQERYEKECTIN